MRPALSAIAAFVVSSVIFLFLNVVTHHHEGSPWATVAVYLGAVIAGAASALMVVAISRLREEERPLPPHALLGALRRQLHDARAGAVEVDASLEVRRCDSRARRLLELGTRWSVGTALRVDDEDPARSALAQVATRALAEGHAAASLARRGGALSVFAVRMEGSEEAVVILLARAEEPAAAAAAVEAPSPQARETPISLTSARAQTSSPPLALGSEAVANVSHELRTPLVSIRGYAELLARGGLGELSPRQQRAVETVLRNLDRLLSMVESLLDLSRLSSGARDPLKLERFDLVALARDVVEMLQPRSDEAGVTLKLRRGGAGDAEQISPLLVSADRIKLHQVLTNLLGNALKFTDPGGRVRVYVREASGEEMLRLEDQLSRARADQLRLSGEWPTIRKRGSWVLLRVMDTGCGIPEEALGRIFDRFYTDDGSRAERAGTGLGLAITDQIVRLHDGVIEVASEVGAGTLFSVWLPVGAAAEAPVAEAELTPPPNVMALPTRAARRGQILLVDDEPDVAEFGRFLLEQEGYAVRLASSAAQLWSALESGPAPEVLLLDYTLPDAVGQELIAQLLAAPGGSGRVIGVVSARTDDATRQACLEAGAWGYLHKPYGIDDLLLFVSSALEEARQSGGASGRVAER